MSAVVNNRFKVLAGRFSLWVGGRVPSPMRLMLSAFAVGLLAGTAAWGLKRMIGGVSHIISGHLSALHANWVLLLLPVVGILLAAVFQRYVIHREIYHGVDRLNQGLKSGKNRLPLSLTVTPMIASTFTLGFGGSAGSEGPIAYTGAAIGSNVGKLLGMSPSMMKVLVACGASAGIAGIFKAPIGGAFFALECLVVEMGSASIIALMIASVTAGLMAYVLSGCTPDIYFTCDTAFDMHWIPWVMAVGVFCGWYSVYYQSIMVRMQAFYAAMRNHWFKNLLAGGIIGGAVFLFPALYGEGYGFISSMLADDTDALTPFSLFAGDSAHTTLVLLMLGGMMLLKAFATSSATSGGGVAGDFAPSLFAGCIAGYFFVTVANVLFGVALPVGYFAFFGMGAVMAATQRAPFMAIFLTVEMGAAFTLLLPVVIVSTVSYFIFRFLWARVWRSVAMPSCRRGT